jgi:hypothetical protein
VGRGEKGSEKLERRVGRGARTERGVVGYWTTDFTNGHGWFGGDLRFEMGLVGWGGLLGGLAGALRARGRAVILTAVQSLRLLGRRGVVLRGGDGGTGLTGGVGVGWVGG